ncbi:hypothetical protein BJF83_08375 [Nocardiopsis sp. CNR-923]|uniref:DUF488 domain-containing protein n=1 Tax=Nocardiopsis sp. CNR-923 TaxID=1904965 RepID=UPI00095EA0B7|nr:DUF488 family protein [Nocardiopsis sp. CNR-923]OLT30321.1 hypothetical protein BJF83_08375 [Nocardiopsis sp. CNR-923]
MAGHGVRVERVYDAVRSREHPQEGRERPSGRHFLVDRLWPRGVSRASLEGVGWLPEAAPSAGLRKWFGHDPARFAEFADRYRAELDARPEALGPVLTAARGGPVTLLYAARDTERNHAIVLRAYLEERLSAEAGGN